MQSHFKGKYYWKHSHGPDRWRAPACGGWGRRRGPGFRGIGRRRRAVANGVSARERCREPAGPSPLRAGRRRRSRAGWMAAVRWRARRDARRESSLYYHGLYVSQEQIVQRIYGDVVDRPAGLHEIRAALSGRAPDVRGRFSSISANSNVVRSSDIVTDLASKWPIIVGLRGAPIGHAYVLTAVYYRVGPYNEPIFDRVVLRDPWPTSPSRQELNWAEFQRRLMFTARVYVVRH